MKMTLLPAPSSKPLDASSLKAWLDGNWALLFSHPDDFACREIESDRWLILLQEELTAADVRPLRLAPSGSEYSGRWVLSVGGGTFVVDPKPSHDTRLHFLPHRDLCDSIRNTSSRFVLILDELLHRRFVLTYEPTERVPSPLDLAAMASTLRRRSSTAAATQRFRSTAAKQRCPTVKAEATPCIFAELRTARVG